jgi:hypothetical protein
VRCDQVAARAPSVWSARTRSAASCSKSASARARGRRQVAAGSDGRSICDRAPRGGSASHGEQLNREHNLGAAAGLVDSGAPVVQLGIGPEAQKQRVTRAFAVERLNNARSATLTCRPRGLTKVLCNYYRQIAPAPLRCSDGGFTSSITRRRALTITPSRYAARFTNRGRLRRHGTPLQADRRPQPRGACRPL